MKEIPKIIYNLDRAREEAEKMRALTGEMATREDYNAAEELIESKREGVPVKEKHSSQEGLKYKVSEQLELNREEKLEKLIGGQFDKIISGTWKTKSDKLSKISILSGMSKDSLIVVLYQNSPGKEIKETLMLNKDCQLCGSDREIRRTGLNRTQLYDELIEIFENVNFDFYENIENSLLPPDSIPWPRGNGPVPEEEVDPRRMSFMENQPRVLFGITGINSGFRGYYGYVFSNFIVMENNKLGNAAYFIPLNEPIKIDEERFKLDFINRVKKEERKIFIEENKSIFTGLTKMQVLDFVPGSAKKKHPNRKQNEEIWMKKMQKEIDLRLNQREAA